MKYSVLLMYPFYDDGPETYFQWAAHDSPEEAEKLVRARASEDNDDLIAPEDFHLIAVFDGYVTMAKRNDNQP